MVLAALARRIIYPRIDTPEGAWKAAANSVYAGAILALNRMLFGTVLLSSPEPISRGLAQVGIGLIYILLARIAYRRSRVASFAILFFAAAELLIEVLILTAMHHADGYLSQTLIFAAAVAATALVLAFGGARGASAIFVLHNKSKT